MLVAAEADKHRPMFGGCAKGSIAAENMLFLPMFFDDCSRDMRLRSSHLLVKLFTRVFGSPYDLLLILNWQRIESGGIVHPLLHQENAPACTRRLRRDQSHIRRHREAWILGSINESG